MLKLNGVSGNTLSQLNLLKLSPQKRRRVMRMAGRKVRRESRQNLKKQEGIEGKRWENRSNGKKGRMLKRIGRHLIVKTSTDNAQITFGNTRVGKVAKAHQTGATQTMTSAEAKKIYGNDKKTDPATRRQAKALREAGYKVRQESGKGWKKPSLRWIQDNLNAKQAATILKELRGTETKKKWKIKLKKRDFLGQSTQEIQDTKQLILSEATRLSN